MSGPAEATVVELFAQLEPKANSARSWRAEIDQLLSLHESVACSYAESAYMRLTSLPDFVDGTMPNDELGERMKADFDALVEAAAEVREQRGANDDVTRLLAEARLIHAYYGRYNAILLQACLVPKGGRA